MNNQHIDKKVTSLPFTQQVALWTILRMQLAEERGFNFLSSEFAKVFKPIASKHLSSSSKEYGKFVGATLSGLVRNGILVKLTGDRDKKWTLSDEMKENFTEIRKKLFEIKVYWK